MALLLLCAALAGAQGFGTTFTVSGVVRDVSGQPVAGAKLIAHCGWATLLPTGEAQSGADGRYTLHFRPGAMIADERRPPRVGLQAATISVHKPGYYEINLSRQANLGMASEEPDPDVLRAVGSGFVGIVLAGKTYPLDFTLAPAAAITGALKDDRGNPLEMNRKKHEVLTLVSDKLYPSSSVLTNIEVRADSTFEATEVPVRPVWFEFRDSRSNKELRSPNLDISIPTTYTVDLRVHRPLFGASSLSMTTQSITAASKSR